MESGGEIDRIGEANDDHSPNPTVNDSILRSILWERSGLPLSKIEFRWKIFWHRSGVFSIHGRFFAELPIYFLGIFPQANSIIIRRHPQSDRPAGDRVPYNHYIICIDGT
jgi:hypothetical protein